MKTLSQQFSHKNYKEMKKSETDVIQIFFS